MAQAIFNFDDLNWSEKEISVTKEEAEELCAKHNGEMYFVNGIVRYRRDKTPYYNEPESWPKYIVCWEDDTPEVKADRGECNS